MVLDIQLVLTYLILGIRISSSLSWYSQPERNRPEKLTESDGWVWISGGCVFCVGVCVCWKGVCMYIYIKRENGVFVSSFELFVSFVQTHASARTHTHFSGREDGRSRGAKGEGIYFCSRALSLSVNIYI